MDPPPQALYATLEELISQANAFAQVRGYKLVVVRSKTNVQGQKTWVHLACDRHGSKRNTHNLTEETRKKHRRSRRCECPMFVVASKTSANMWELNIRHADHNHGPYEPPPPKKRKSDFPQQPASDLVNLPLLQTPATCTADFCLIPIGTQTPSVSNEIAEVQRLLKRSGLHFNMHGAGTTLEGSWDDVMRIIGQAHAFLHSSGVVRIQTDIRIGTRKDKKQTAEDKIRSVQALLDQDEPMEEESTMMTAEVNDDHTPQHTPQQMSQHPALQGRINPANIAPDLDRVMPPPSMHNPHMASMASMSHQMGNPHQMHPHSLHQMTASHQMGPPGMSLQ